jgi:hypothetical protein
MKDAEPDQCQIGVHYIYSRYLSSKRLGQAAGRHNLRRQLDFHLQPLDQPLNEPDIAIEEPRLESSDGVVAYRAARPGDLDAEEFGGMREEGVVAVPKSATMSGPP